MLRESTQPKITIEEAAILLNKDKSYLYKLGRQGVLKITKERPMKVEAETALEFIQNQYPELDIKFK